MHLKFPSLTQFDNVYSGQTYHGAPRALEYGAKIKLHGTNVGIRIETDGTVAVQSKNLDLSIEDDLNNCALWLEDKKPLWAQAATDETLVFYGEWAGPGIGKGDAIQKTGKKRFFIFALGFGEDVHHQDDSIRTSRWMITCPDKIRAFLPEGVEGDDVIVLPWENEDPIIFDFANEAQVNETLDMLNRSVEAVAKVDPYVSRTFDIQHPGEGFVLVPVSAFIEQVSVEYYARTAFKAKTEKHRVRKQGKPATVREPLPESAGELIETFITPARLEQALMEVCGGVADKRATGKMIIWIQDDLQKEAAAEIAALEVPFDRLKGDISKAVRDWFLPLTEAVAA